MPASVEREVAHLRQQLKAHPCHSCPEREDHARWAERWFKLRRDADTLARRVESRTNTVARQFDRVCDVLTALGYLEGEAVTPLGRPLMRLYSELDLVAAESLRSKVWDDLTPSELAAALSTLVFEARRPDDASAPRLPGGRAKEAIAAMVRIWADLDALERDNKLDFLRQPDLGFAWAAFRWAEGDELDEVLGSIELAAGDFVRWMKQLIDLAGQVANAAGDSPVRRNARDLVDLLKRGVVAYSGLAD
jgi:ATP-dependent RNA helicase HelY